MNALCVGWNTVRNVACIAAMLPRSCLSVSPMSGQIGNHFCNDCTGACETHCARITPGCTVRWNAFERIGLADQHEPGAKRNIAFMAWMHDEWREWCRLNGRDRHAHKSDRNHAAFDAWLAARHDVPSPPKSEAA